MKRSIFLMLIALAAISTGGEAAAQAAQADQTLLNPNTATRAQLITVPNIAAATADALIRGRPFATMLAVDSVLVTARLTEEQRDAAYARLFLPLDLNSASDTEILLIPGLGSRMLREFKEYRPYDGIARFRREIGKYVDEAEVARLEKYVRIGAAR